MPRLSIIPVALTLLSVLLPCVALVIYLLSSVKSKSSATKWLTSTFGVGALMILFILLRSATVIPHPAWLLFSDIALVLSITVVMSVLQHGYHYPKLRAELRSEARIVMVLSAISHLFLIIVPRITEVDFIISYLIIMGGHLTQLILLYCRHLYFYTRQANLHGWRAIWFSHQGMPITTLRRFIALSCSPLLIIGVLVWQQIVKPPESTVELIVAGILALLLFTAMFIFMNHLSEPTTLLYKLTSMAFVLLFVLTNCIVYLTLPFLHTAYRPTIQIGQFEHYRYTRVHNGYHLEFIDEPFPLAQHAGNELGDLLPMGNDNLYKIELPFTFPFYTETWNTLLVSDNGYVAFDKPYQQQYPQVAGDNNTPLIAPLLADFDPTVSGKVYLQTMAEGVIITWYEMGTTYGEIEQDPTQNNLQEGTTFRLQLQQDGTIDIYYEEIHIPRSYEFDSGRKNWFRGITPGQRSLVNATSMTSTTDSTVYGSRALIENFHGDLYAYTHQWLAPFAYLMIASALLIVIGFPLFLRYTLLKPLNQLMETMQRVDQGDLTVTIPVQSHDEVGFLSGAFNRMVASIRRNQEELHELNRTLEGRVVERTAQLVQAKEDAILANQAKSTFLANMSHELRTPLNAIQGYTQVLKGTFAGNSPVKRQLTIMEESADHLLMLINDVLDIARIEAGRIDLHPEQVALRPFVAQVAETMLMRAQAKDIRLQYNIDQHVPAYIMADERRLRQILFNLVGNAIKFTERGSVIMTVTRQTRVNKTFIEKLGDQRVVPLRFQISDTGIGIPQSEVDTIFDAFQQSTNTPQRAEGTGLGLAITKHLVSQMGGTIRVDSQEMVGSTFTIDLALPTSNQESQIDQSVERKIVGVVGSAPIILVVDDKWQNRAVLVDLLKPLGFQVFEAENGIQALDCVRDISPAIVITDLVMPHMDGFELIRRLRLEHKEEQVKVFVMSASIVENEQQRSLAVGANAFLAKPIATEALLKRIQEHLSIQWKYQPLLVRQTGTLELESMPENKQRPHRPDSICRNTLRQLHTAANIGDIATLQAMVQTIQTETAVNHPFLVILSRYVALFQIQGLCDWLEGYLDEENVYHTSS